MTEGIDWRARAERLWDILTDCSNVEYPHADCAPAVICHIEKALREAALPVSSRYAEGESPSLEKQLSEAKENARAVARAHAERVEALESQNMALRIECEALRKAADQEEADCTAAEAKVSALEADNTRLILLSDGRRAGWERAAEERDEARALHAQLSAVSVKHQERARAAEARAEALAGLLRTAIERCPDCAGKGERSWWDHCYRCEDSTDDHVCEVETHSARCNTCRQARDVLAASPSEAPSGGSDKALNCQPDGD